MEKSSKVFVDMDVHKESIDITLRSRKHAIWCCSGDRAGARFPED